MPSRTKNWILSAGIVVVLATISAPAFAYVDVNGNKIDDRIESVHQNGWAHAFEDLDPQKKMLIGVFEGAPIQYALYVGYDHDPTDLDETLLANVGVPYVKPYFSIDYLRTQATFVQVEQIASLPGVTQVEAIPMMYAANHFGTRVVRARSSAGLRVSENYALFPNARDHLGLDGEGVVIAILDTGANDDVDTANPLYPGHESLQGKFLGGGEFFSGDPNLNTGINDSMNPQDHGAAASSYHSTHVSGTAMGTGGQDGFFAGVAPAARLVDCKVLSDAGAGFGAADGLDWCVANVNNDWGLTGPDAIYQGIDVINMSLSSGGSNGNDANSAAANAAVNAGIVVCASSGNGSAINQCNSPAAADLAIAVGAATHSNSLDRSDDLVADFSNEGPRANDGDLNMLDEYKPNVTGPGVGIMSANGDPATEGGAYQKLSGTSMSAPHVSGVAALIRQANPALTPTEVRIILQNTAIHHLSSQKGDRGADPSGVDPNYSPMSGWGMVDAYAAAKEALNSTTGVQVVRLGGAARAVDLEIDFMWWTQREHAFNGFHVHRAPDVGGAPGAFAQITTVLVPGAGDPLIEGDLLLPGSDSNRTPYVYVDADAALQLGETYWYQLEWVDTTGTGHLEPPVPITFGDRQLVTTLFYSIKHNTPDNDLTINVGSSSLYDPESAEFIELGKGAANADSVVVEEPANAGTAVTGYIHHYWSVGFTASELDPFLGSSWGLPPSQQTPWFVNVLDDCFLNRAGTMTSFSMFVNDSPGSPSGTTYITDSVTPQPTIETCLNPVKPTTSLWIPESQTVAVAARLEGFALEGGLRIRVELGETGALVALSRGRTHEFANRSVVHGPRAVAGTSYEYLDQSVEAGKQYWYWVEVTGRDGSRFMTGPLTLTALDTRLGRSVALTGAPAIVSGRSEFRYVIGRDIASQGAVPVSITLHDVRGRTVRVLKDGLEGVGEYQLVWDGSGNRGHRVSSGVYYILFRAGPMIRSSKLTVLW